MAELIGITAFRHRFFVPESRPTRRTVWFWCKNGDIPATQIGSKWYIDISAFKSELASKTDSDKVEQALVEKILNS